MATTNNPTQFALLSRILHWLMAAMLLAMLFIGVSMVASLGNYHRLVSIHRPLGIMILILAAIRLINRKLTKLPPFPPTMSSQERFAATTSEKLLYFLMFALPLVGWGMLSAGHYPIVMFGPFHLPPILPAIPTLYAVLRKAHTILAYLLFLTFLAHLSAVLFHTLIIRDRLLNRMALWPTPKTAAQTVTMPVSPATDDKGDVEQGKVEQTEAEVERPNAEEPETGVEKPNAEEKAKT
ncbi:MAG TPA: cytochrome b, partial [Chthoniobacterales bacterium]|nr:cytochrome b [Chthoniobacterales bacterium]